MRKVLLEEAETELWRKWRQRKGRGMRNWAQVGEKETMEQKLKIVEEQTEKYKLELERMEKRRLRREEEQLKEMQEKNKRLETKRNNEKHWEMMRWITKFMKENLDIWNRRKDDEREKQKRMVEIDEWREKTEKEKIEMLKSEKNVKPKLSREEKIQIAKESSERWRNWRQKENKKEEKEAVEEDDEQQMGGGSPRGLSFPY